jgi:hypothetical protein
MSVNVNVPCTVTIGLDGTVTLQTVKTQSYDLSEPHASFNGFLTDEILDAFIVKHNGARPGANLSVDVSANAAEGFESALWNNLKYAPMEAAPASTTLEAFLKKWATAELTKELAANQIAAALEAGALDNLAFNDIDGSYASGVTDMFSGIKELSPAVRAVIATQISNEKFLSAANGVGDGKVSARLPLEGGDSMTFQFIISQNFVVSEQAASADYSSNGAIQSGAGQKSLIGSYSVAERRVNVVLTRPMPADYHGLPSVPSAPSASFLDAVSSALSDAQGAYDGAVESADTIYGHWSELNDLNVIRLDKVAAKAAAEEMYAADVVSQTAALAAADGATSGPLYDAAQAAIAKTAASLVVKDAAVAAAVTAADNLAAAEASLTVSLSAASAANQGAIANVAQKLSDLNDAKDAYDAKVAERDIKQEEHDYANLHMAAAHQAADTYAALCMSQWSDASGAAWAAINAVETPVTGLRAVADADAATVVSSTTALNSARAAYMLDKSEANAAAVASAQQTLAIDQAAAAKSSAALAAGVVAANAKIVKANDALARVPNAAGFTDSPVSGTFLADNTIESLTV